jgi:uncharacterized damage-inducible protein DinB
LEAGQRLRISGDVVRQELEGDKAVQPGVFGLVDDAHAAATDLLNNAVVRDGPADHWRSMLLVVKPASQRTYKFDGLAVDGECHRLSSTIRRGRGWPASADTPSTSIFIHLSVSGGNGDMKSTVALLVLSLSFHAYAQDPKPATLRSVLLEQLRTTHSEKDWFVPIDVAVEGLTAEQATWKDGSGNHSVGQLTNHLLFWNRQELAKFEGEPKEKFSGNNDETFNNFDAKKWNDTVKQLDQVMTELENLVETADDKQLQAWASEIAHIGTHNAYHVGQMIFVRKLQGSWNPEKGVK